MARLYIIGNGFDIAHRMKTSYWDFKKWLAEQEDSAPKSLLWVLSNLESYCNVENFWSSLELSLGHMDIRSYLKEIMGEHQITDINDEHYGELGEAWDAVYAQLITIDAEMGLDVISDIFADWIRTIQPASAQEPQYQQLSGQDLYLSFNYTNTLEELYAIPSSQVLHIHGLASDAESILIFGHGHMYDLDKCDAIGEEVMGIDAEGVARMYGTELNNLYKDTESIYLQNQGWFDNLTNAGITEIVALGFSFGEVDDRYFREIKHRLPNAKWYFSIYTKNELTRRVDIEHANDFIKRVGINPKSCCGFDSEEPDININL